MASLAGKDNSFVHLPPEPDPGPPLDRRDLPALAALIAALLVVFWKVVFTPAMFFYRDIFAYTYPHARFIHESLRSGELPYWNPYLHFGSPVLSNPNFLFFYPSTFLQALFPVDFAFTMHFVGHLGLAGVGTYFLARRWSQSHCAALFAGVVFMLSGPVLSLGNFYNQVAASAWIPWALLAADRAARARSLRPWVELTVVFAVQYLAGEPFTSVATILLSFAYALFCSGGFRHPLAAESRRVVAGFAASVALTVALVSIQLLPALDLLRNSRRGIEGLPFNETTSWSFHPLALLDTLVPDFFGSALHAPTLWSLVLSCRNMPYFPSIFLGFIPVFFALAGWALAKEPRRKFVAVAALGLLVLSFGRFTPVFALAYLLVPPLSLVRFPIKLLVPAVLMIALLAGWGLDALRRWPMTPQEQPARKLVVPLAVFCALVGMAWLASFLIPRLLTEPAAWILQRTNEMFLRGPAGVLSEAQVASAAESFLRLLQIHFPGLAGFALGGIVLVVGLKQRNPWAHRVLPIIAGLAVCQLAWENSRVNPTVPKSFYTYHPPVLQHLNASETSGRVAFLFREAEAPSDTPDAQGFLNLESIPDAASYHPIAQLAFRDRLVLARGTMLDRVESVSNIDVEGSFPPFLFEYWVMVMRGFSNADQADCLLGRSNVRYQVLRARQPSPVRREVAPIFNGSPEPHWLYENLCATPRAFVTGSARVVKDVKERLETLADSAFDPLGEVLLASEGGNPLAAENGGSTGSVEIVDRDANEVVLRACLDRPGYVVLLDRFDPNWRAALDGREAPILRANQLFRAVRAGPGEHEVRFTYRQRGLRTGALFSALALALLAFFYGVGARR